MIDIQVDKSFESSVDSSVIEQAAQEVLRHEGADKGKEITIAIIDDEQIQKLNLQFLSHDTPTDVLSFPANETNPDTGFQYLGDVIISYPRALEQAESGGHPLNAELQLLVVHGVLHLLGYDHANETEKTRMWAVQADVLNQIGSPITGPANEPNS